MVLRVIFFLVIFFALQGFVYYNFVRYLKTTRIYKPSHRWWSLIPFLLFNLPFIVISLIWGRSFIAPEWFKITGVYPFYIWQGATFFIALWLIAGKLLKLPFKIPLWIAKLIKPAREKLSTLKIKTTAQKVNYSRRKFVRYATMGVSAYAFGGAAYGIIKHDSYEITHKDVTIENLPPELRGTTITLISDIHSGQYMSERDMAAYAEVVNSLGSDIICIPGDFVNFDTAEVHPLTKAFRDLKAKHGVYGSLGNHDFFMNADYVARALVNESPIQLLRNEHRVININGKELYMLGIDDTISSGARMDEVLKYYGDMDTFLRTNDANYVKSPKILMCHKPYGFDILATKEPDLILSGHTHGGQVVPLKLGNFHLSFASTVSKYIDGLYKIGKSNMYVSRGLGSVALPIRINCPPEITVLKLV